jgi:hypothetical protein
MLGIACPPTPAKREWGSAGQDTIFGAGTYCGLLGICAGELSVSGAKRFTRREQSILPVLTVVLTETHDQSSEICTRNCT